MIRFELLESIDEYNCKLKGFISGDKFEIEDNKVFIYHNDKLISMITFKDWAISGDDDLEKYHIYI